MKFWVEGKVRLSLQKPSGPKEMPGTWCPWLQCGVISLTMAANLLERQGYQDKRVEAIEAVNVWSQRCVDETTTTTTRVRKHVSMRIQ